MRDYQQGKIYKIVCNETGKVYYGSTIESTVARRLSSHVANFKKYKEGKQYCCTSFEILTNNNYTIVLVELYPCNSKDELLMRERHWIENNECINKRLPITTKEEKTNEKKNYDKNYVIIHKEKKQEQVKIYRQIHKEKIANYHHQYKQQHIEEIKKNQKKIIQCECGQQSSNSNLSRHKKSKRHNEIMQSRWSDEEDKYWSKNIIYKT